MSAIAEAIGVDQDGDRDSIAVIAGSIDDPTLLLIDNCEHLLDSVAAVVAPFLRSTPELRVIATAGQTIDLRDGRVYVDGQLVEIPQAHGLTQPQAPRITYPFRVPAGEIFVLGDNRQASSDSRTFGSVPIQNIIGKVVLRFWPADRLTFFEW